MTMVRVSSVGIATCYGLDGPGIESRWGRDFPQPSRPPWGPPSLLYNGYRVCFPVVKRPGRGADHSPPSSADGEERVELYLYSPSGPSWPVLRWTSPLLYLCLADDSVVLYKRRSKRYSYLFRLQIRITDQRIQRGLQLCTLLVVLNAGLPYFPSLPARRGTALQSGRSPVRFPVGSLKFFLP
jgi:hypothetical protein